MKAALGLSDPPTDEGIEMRGFDCSACSPDQKALRRCPKPSFRPGIRADNDRIKYAPDRHRCYRLELEEMPEAGDLLADYPDFKRRGLNHAEIEATPVRWLEGMRLVDNVIASHERDITSSSKQKTPLHPNADPAWAHAAMPPPPFGRGDLSD